MLNVLMPEKPALCGFHWIAAEGLRIAVGNC